MDASLLAQLNEERRARRAAILATELDSASSRLIREGDALSGELVEAVARAFRSGKSGTVEADGKTLFLNVHRPPARLVVIGAVHISQTLAPMAALAGFDLEIIDPRTAFATEERFGGTRIGDALGEFNRRWSRRVLGQGASVILITDGLERSDVEGLGHEMERLRKSCRRLVWLNPLLRFDGFEPRARGVRAMLPHVDEFRPAHNLEALSDLVRSLSEGRSGETDPRRWLALGKERAA